MSTSRHFLGVPYWSFTSADTITIWATLDDATVETGRSYDMPGSHKARKFDCPQESCFAVGTELGRSPTEPSH